MYKLPTQLLLLLVIVVVNSQSLSNSIITLSPGAAIFTYPHDYIEGGLRIVYRPDFTASGVNASLNDLQFCMLYDYEDYDNSTSREEFDNIIGSLRWPLLLELSRTGGYLYQDLALNRLKPNTWILYEVRAYRGQFQECPSHQQPDYIDTYRFFYVPSEIYYCELDYAKSNITKCSEVLDGTAEGIVHGANKPHLAKLPECSTPACLSSKTNKVIAVIVISLAASIIAVVVAKIVRYERKQWPEEPIPNADEHQSVNETLDHLEAAPRGAYFLLPQYRNLPAVDAPPAYEEQS